MSEREKVDIKNYILIYLQNKYDKNHRNYERLEDILQDVFDYHLDNIEREVKNEMETREYD